MPKPPLDLRALLEEAAHFAEVESTYNEPSLFGTTDGKAVGTYLEHKFARHLQMNYDYAAGNSASGIDFPSLNVDLKVTSVRQPQSSCPYRSARQKIFGLGYHLLVFVYDKRDDHDLKTACLQMHHTIFVDQSRTGDFQTTSGLRRIVANDGNEDDVVAFLQERNLPVDEIEARQIARQVLATPPVVGMLTISNALQWRLQYTRAIAAAGTEPGLTRLR